MKSAEQESDRLRLNSVDSDAKEVTFEAFVNFKGGFLTDSMSIEQAVRLID
jgi:hypothetical protein